MNKLLLALLMLFFALPAYTAEESAVLMELAEKLRHGAIDVGTEYSMDHRTGRFHIIHSDVLGLTCSNCHYGHRYPADYLLMGKEKPYPPLAKGVLQRSPCLGCHRQGGEATPWFQSGLD